LDSAYLAATSEDKGCRVWEIATVKVVADLIPRKVRMSHLISRIISGGHASNSLYLD